MTNISRSRFSLILAFSFVAIAATAFSVSSSDQKAEAAASYTYIKIASANAPESAKDGLIVDRDKRALEVLKQFNSANTHIATLTETGTYMNRASNTNNPVGNAWNFSQKFWNIKTNGLDRGNGQAWDSTLWKPIQRHDFRVACSGGKGGDCEVPSSVTAAGYLTIPVQLYKKNSNKALVAVVSFHAPTQRADTDNSTRNKVNATIKTVVNQLENRGIPVIIGGDANDGAWASKIGTDKIRVLGQDGVDWIVASRSIKQLNDGVWNFKSMNLSDHNAVWATAEVPVVTGKNLPWQDNGVTLVK